MIVISLTNDCLQLSRASEKFLKPTREQLASVIEVHPHKGTYSTYHDSDDELHLVSPPGSEYTPCQGVDAVTRIMYNASYCSRNTVRHAPTGTEEWSTPTGGERQKGLLIASQREPLHSLFRRDHG